MSDDLLGLLEGSLDLTESLDLKLLEHLLGLADGLVSERVDLVLNRGDVWLAVEDLGQVVASTTVVNENVGRVAGDVGQNVAGADGNHVLLELSGLELGEVARIGLGLEGQEVGQEPGDVGGGHRGAGDGVDGVLAANPGRLDVQAGGKDVSTLSVVGEVRALVAEGGGTDGDGLLGGSGRVVASIGIVITGSDGEVDARLDGSVDSHVERWGLATTKRHVGGRTLEIGILLGRLLDVRLGGPLNTLDDVRHSARSVGAEHLDCEDVGLLGDTVLLTTDSTGAVSSVSVAVDIGITSRNGLAPLGTALEVNVLNVRASIDDVNVDTRATAGLVDVLVEVAEVQTLLVRDTGESPGGVFLGDGIFERVDDRVLLNVRDLQERSSQPNPAHDRFSFSPRTSVRACKRTSRLVGGK